MHHLLLCAGGTGSWSSQRDGSLTPVAVPITGNIAASTFLAVGYSHSCVAVNYGQEAAMCWG